MDFVVNEWLPEYLRPTANPEEREKASAFLKAFSVVELMRFSEDIGAGSKSFSGMADLDTLPNV